MSATYEYGTFTQDYDASDEGGNYLYSLRQFVLMRRCGRPFATWEEVIDYADEWFRKHEDLDPNELKTYTGWAATPEVWVF